MILTFYGQILQHSVYFIGNLICVVILWNLLHSFVKFSNEGDSRFLGNRVTWGILGR